MPPLRSIHTISVALIPTCLVATRPATAQVVPPPMEAVAVSQAVPSTHDSARAVALACSVIQGLRPPGDRHGCRLERFGLDSGGRTIRLIEVGPPGARSVARSIVRLPDGADSVIVTRRPEP